MKKLSLKNVKPIQFFKRFIFSDWFTSLVILAFAIAATVVFREDITAFFTSDASHSTRVDLMQMRNIGIAILAGFIIFLILFYNVLKNYKIASKLVLFTIDFILSFVINVYLTALTITILLISEYIDIETLLIDIMLAQITIFIFGIYVVFRNLAEKLKKDPSDRNVVDFHISLVMKRSSLVWLVPVLLPLAVVMVSLSLTWPYIVLIILTGILIALYSSLVFSKQIILLIYAILHLKRRKHG